MMCEVYNKIAKILDYEDCSVKEVSLGDFVAVFFVLFAHSIIVSVHYLCETIECVMDKKFFAKRIKK